MRSLYIEKQFSLSEANKSETLSESCLARRCRKDLIIGVIVTLSTPMDHSRTKILTEASIMIQEEVMPFSSKSQ